MVDWKTALPIVDKFITWATPKKVLLLALAAVVSIALVTSYQKRADLVKIISGKLSGGTVSSGIPELAISLTEDVKLRIHDLVDKNPDLNYIAVVSANIRINQRELIHFYADDPVISEEMKAGTWHEGSTQSIFTSSEAGNEQMVAVINGEFGCFKYEDTINFIAAPALASRMPYVCRVSLPPYYGEFSGYLAFGLTRKPDESRANDIRIEAVRLATEIYFKSIAKGRKAPG